MALERKDNIGDTTASTGTGTINLAAVAQTGALIFAGNVTSGATVRYDIRSSDNTEWEIGEGVFTDGSPDTLTRVTVYKSSNAGSLVNFSAGTKNVSMVFVAQDIIDIMSALNPIGTIREFTVSTNPGTLLGFGTWGAFGTGRVTVAIDAGQTEFDTVEETGGAKTVSIAHTHTIPSSGTLTSYYGGVAGNSGIAPGSDYLQAGHTHPASGAMSANETPSIVQPYIVVYRWVRTA